MEPEVLQALQKKKERKQRFEQWLCSKHLSLKSVRDYLFYYEHFGGGKNFNQDYVDEFLIRFRHSVPSRAFVNNFKEYLIKRHPENSMISRVTMTKITGQKARLLPEFVTEEEVKLIEEAMTDERNKLMLLITFYCGLRIGGLLGVKFNDFYMKEFEKDKTQPAKLKVIEKGSKERIVFIPAKLTLRIRKWMREQRGNFSTDKPLWEIKDDRWRYILAHAGRKALSRHVKPHALRHGTATMLIKKGWKIEEVADFLGHDSIVTTQIYLHMDKTELKNKYAEGFSQTA